MSTAQPAQTGQPAKTTSGSSGAIDWSALMPKSVDMADTIEATRVSKTWNKIYTAAGYSGKSETERAGLRLGVYVYFLLNGTSREGNYTGDIVLSDGHRFPASVLPIAIGKFDMRRFARGNMEESYVALKAANAVERYPRVVARAATLGVSAQEAFVLADWMTDCPLFTPLEAQGHAAAFRHSIDRARRARDGKTLETVEHDRLAQELEVQGPSAAASSRSIDF